MDLRCKQGDVAIIVAGAPEYIGRVVRVGRFIGEVPGWVGNDRWEVDGEFPGKKYGTPAKHYRDTRMRPIRDPGEDAKDETLEWLPVPEKVTA